MGMFGAVRKLVGGGSKRDPFEEGESGELPRGARKSPGGKRIVWVIFQYGRPTQVELSRTDANIDHLKKRLKSVFPRHLGHLEAFEFGVKSQPSDSSIIPEDTLLANLRLGADASSALYIWLPCTSGAPSLVSPAYRHGCVDEDSLWRSGHLEQPTRFPPVGAAVHNASEFESISTSVPPSYNSEAVRAILKERMGLEPSVVDSGRPPRPPQGEEEGATENNPGSPSGEDNCFSLQGSAQNEMFASVGDTSVERSDTLTKQVVPDFSVFHHDLNPADVAKLLADQPRKGALGTQKYSRRAASTQARRLGRGSESGFERSSWDGFTAQLRKASLEDATGRKIDDDDVRIYDNSFNTLSDFHVAEKPKFFSFQAEGKWKRGSVGEQMQPSAGRQKVVLTKPRSFWRSFFKGKSENDSSRQSRPPPTSSNTRSTPNSALFSRSTASYDMQSSNYSVMPAGLRYEDFPCGDLTSTKSEPATTQ
eukprot:TRINITY_DN17181_c0_g1_i1.p1 TRINITY_DN17181_c0_g1~~TRINITY_DN17181_c0_g1_i1.p1  ORF type:complete len:479 (-),score=82.14 TRINITY_DN17181_c0_g1_i1:816-2252(-)